MRKKIFSGGYLLINPDNKSQFGIVSASTYVDEIEPIIRVALGKQLLNKLETDDDGYVTLNLSLSESSKLAEMLTTVNNSIELLVTLSKRNRLSEDAYYSEDDPTTT